VEQETNALTAARQRIGIAQKDLAEITGISVDKLSKIEHGARSIQTDELITLSYALGVAPAELASAPPPAQLRPGEAVPANVRAGMEVLDRYIENCHYLDGLAAISGEG
jgi:transcriptional regulator with XRE-family HTH domain